MGQRNFFEKKSADLYSRYCFPDTDFTVYMSNVKAGNMGRSVAEPSRSEFYRAAGIDAAAVISLRQIHSRKVISASMWHDGAEADGVVDREGGHVLGITSADCLPVFIFHPVQKCFGAFHSGWKGTGIVVKGLKLLRDASGCPAREFFAFIGPGIGRCCYNVDEKRACTFSEDFGPKAAVSVNGQWFLDLKEVNRHILAEAGITTVFTDEDCTACSPQYGSYRREGPESFTLMLSLGMYQNRKTYHFVAKMSRKPT
ncbi:MAG: polyphenol oxidase family protein [Spirochaetales bacterium]|nr:polyphenol oxidase family protein [Spirochaetales bacterium]